MRIAAVGENLLERLAVRLRVGPRPLLETHGTVLLARALMAATRAGVFEALAAGPLGAAEVAARCGTAEHATAALLAVLETARYVRSAGGRYALAPDARRWLLAGSASSLRDNVLFRFTEWPWIEGLDRFLATGRPLDIHAGMSPEQWGAYQRGMRSLATVLAREVAWRTPVPRRARTMLDLGGGHGLYSVALCRRHGTLAAVVLDLPEALAQAPVPPVPDGLGDRIEFRAGDARAADLGAAAFDLVLASNLLHHFDPAQGRDLVRRAALALRPGGILVVQELFAPATARRRGQLTALADLYFAMTSLAGSRSAAELAAWQREAGLRPRRPLRFLSFPGAGQQSAVKP
jgi:SAM-dependent methyltransferase